MKENNQQIQSSNASIISKMANLFRKKQDNKKVSLTEEVTKSCATNLGYTAKVVYPSRSSHTTINGPTPQYSLIQAGQHVATTLSGLSGLSGSTTAAIIPTSLQSAIGASQAGYSATSKSNSILIIHDTNGKELVRLEKDGTVSWNSNATVDDATTAFAKVLSLGAEKAAGLTYSVKQRMRDAVFEEVISMAKEKGNLSADDLTYLWQAAKIMDKLKGAKE